MKIRYLDDMLCGNEATRGQRNGIRAAICALIRSIKLGSLRHDLSLCGVNHREQGPPLDAFSKVYKYVVDWFYSFFGGTQRDSRSRKRYVLKIRRLNNFNDYFPFPLISRNVRIFLTRTRADNFKDKAIALSTEQLVLRNSI